MGIFFGRKKVFTISKSANSSGLRFLLLVGVFALAGYLFNKNIEARFSEIKAVKSIIDENMSFNEDTASKLAELLIAFEENYTTRLIVHSRSDDILLPALKPNALFVAISPNKKQHMLIMPDLLEKVLKDTKASHDLELARCNEAVNHGDCVLSVVNNIYTELDS